MAVLIEPLLRNTNLTQEQRRVCLKGIAATAAADKVIDPRETQYLKAFLDEFFEGQDPASINFDDPVAPEDLKVLDTERAKDAFTAYLYITAYLDENFCDEEKQLIDSLTADLVTPERREELLAGVRSFLYRRAAFSYAFRFNRLDEAFARELAKRFDLTEEQAIELNAAVFNAVMAMKGPAAQKAEAAQTDQQ